MAENNAEATPDLAQPYMAQAQARTVDANIEDFLRRTQQTAEPETTAGPAPAQPQQAIERAPVRITVAPGKPPSAKLKAPTGSALEAVGAVKDDVLRGLYESGTQIRGGVTDAVRNAVTGMRDLADWLGDTVGGEIPVPSTGSQTADKIIQRPLTALTEALPDKVKEAQSVTGGVIREGARFLTGFVPALRAFGHMGPAGAITAGALSDFATMDPDQGGLANLLQAVPALQNPVAEFLSSKPGDNEALSRLRHAVEGAGFGALTEGVIRGIRALAAARKAVPEIEAQKTLYGEIKPEAPGIMTATPDEPLVSVAGNKLAASAKATEAGVTPDVVAKGVVGSAKVPRLEAAGLTGKEAVTSGPDVFVNFGRINTAEDVKQVIRDTADAFKGDINKARRGVQSNEETAKLADELGMTAEDLLSRQKGQPFNAEQSLAARRLLKASADKLLEFAGKAADPLASTADQFNFRRMLAIHHAIQSEVIAARTETARALQAWSIPADLGGVEKARAVQMLMENAGGPQVAADLAKRISLLGAQGVPAAALANAARRGWMATTKDAVQEAFVLGLLWAPPTHIVNSASNLAVAFQQIYERAVAGRIGRFLGTAVDERVVDGEALAMTWGMINSLKDAFRLGARSIKTGETGASLGKIDLPYEGAISSATISRELGHSVADAQSFAQTPMGRAVDFVGTVTRAPGRLLGAEDEFFKTIAYRGEVNAQALRQATQEGATGKDLWRRMAEIANDPPEHIRIAAADAALYATFTNTPGKWAQSVMNLRNNGSLNPTFMVLTFVRTPANILRYTFERSPIAPLVGQWRADVAAGGARRDLALARMATGTAILAMALDAADAGYITGAGPSNAAKKEVLLRQGWQPYSVYIGGKYYSYSRGDPVAMIFGFAATVAEKMKEKDFAPEDFDEMSEQVAAAIGTVAISVVDKTYFQGVSQFITMLQGSEKGPGGVATYVDKQTGSLLPFSSAFQMAKKFVDPVTREVNSPWDAIQSRIAGISDALPPARDLWGEERKPEAVFGRAYDALSPVAVSKDKASPVDAELERLHSSVSRIKKKTAFAGADVNFRDYPDVYDEYVRLAGNELKHPAWNLGAKDFLDAVISGKHSMSGIYQMYSDGPEGGKASFIKNTVAEYRKLAQDKIMSERSKFPVFADYIDRRSEERKELKLPTPMQGQGINKGVRLGGPL